VAFATARGFREERAEAQSVLDPRTVDERPAPHIDLRRVADLDPRLVYEVDIAATRDMPSTETIDEIPYDEWVGRQARVHRVGEGARHHADRDAQR